MTRSRRSAGRCDATYHRRLFQWHCRTFFPLDTHLQSSERSYLETCFALTEDFTEVAPSGVAHFSYYTYSHRVSGAAANSSRFAIGSIVHPAEAARAAEPVLRERGIAVDDLLAVRGCHFGGLGWDLLAAHFKIYFRVDELAVLPVALRQQVPSSDAEVRAEGIVSRTYGEGKLFEEKIYVYPIASVLPIGTRAAALMRTSRRGVVPQYDVVDAAPWLAKLNAVGRRIIRAYDAIGEPLDTIAFTDTDHFTLYFP